jgi:hypothetical protein
MSGEPRLREIRAFRTLDYEAKKARIRDFARAVA